MQSPPPQHGVNVMHRGTNGATEQRSRSSLRITAPPSALVLHPMDSWRLGRAPARLHRNTVGEMEPPSCYRGDLWVNLEIRGWQPGVMLIPHSQHRLWGTPGSGLVPPARWQHEPRHGAPQVPPLFCSPPLSKCHKLWHSSPARPAAGRPLFRRASSKSCFMRRAEISLPRC